MSGGLPGAPWGRRWRRLGVVAALGALVSGCDSGDRASAPAGAQATGAGPAAGAASGQPAEAAALACGPVETLGVVAAPAIRECSGLAVSRSQPVLWLHNDSGDAARLYAIDTTGQLLATVTLAGASARDWEDMAVGPYPDGSDGLFVGDIGDNARVRGGVRVFRVREPRVDPARRGVVMNVTDYDVLELSYPDGPHDAETLLVDGRSGDVYILTKAADGRSGLYRAAWPDGGSRVSMERVLQLEFGSGLLSGSTKATAGDLSRDGTRAVIRTYNRVFMFQGAPGVNPVGLLSGRPRRVPVPWIDDGEAIALAPDGASYYLLSEGGERPLHRVVCP